METMTIKTKAGEITVRENGDPDYPGATIRFKPFGSKADVEVVAVEVHEGEGDLDNLYVYTYENEESEDVTRRFELNSGKIKKWYGHE